MLSEQHVFAIRAEEKKRVLEGVGAVEAGAASLREPRISKQA